MIAVEITVTLDTVATYSFLGMYIITVLVLYTSFSTNVDVLLFVKGFLFLYLSYFFSDYGVIILNVKINLLKIRSI